MTYNVLMGMLNPTHSFAMALYECLITCWCSQCWCSFHRCRFITSRYMAYR